MKRISILILFVLVSVLSNGQNIRGNSLWSHTTRTSDTSYVSTGLEEKGAVYWDEDEQTTSRVVGNGVILQDGQELFVDAINQSGALLENGKVAMFAGAVGASGKIKIQYGIADLSIITYPEYIIGVITEDIANGEEGKVTTYGKVRGFQTDGLNYGETWSDGDELYVSTTTYGALTNVRPQAPFPAISIAAVIRAHPTNGTILVRPTFPDNLADLSDVNGTPLVSNGQFPVWDNDNSYFDFDYNIIDIMDGIIPDSIWNNINSAARLWGGLITDNGDGTVAIGAGAGQIKAENAGPEDVPMMINEGQGSVLGYVSWDAVSSLSLTDDAYNFIYFDGTDSTIKATTDFYSISFTQDFTLGRGYRDGTDIVVRLCGTNLWNFNRRVQLFGEEVFPVVRGTGLIIGDASNLQFTITAGILWAELVNRFSVAAYDGTTTNFTYWYRDGLGGWTKTTSSQIDNINYDDGSGTLAALIANRYGVHWVYSVHDGSVHVVYGRDSYTALGADNAFAPNTLPGLLSSYATLVGKITVQKSATTFTEVLSAFDVQLQSGSVATNHNDLAGLDGGESGYYGHLTSAEKSNLSNIGTSTLQDVTDNGNTTTNTISHADGVLDSESATVGQLNSAISGVSGGTSIDTITYTNHGLTAGDWFGYKENSIIKSQADTSINADVVGVVKSVIDVNSFTYQSDGIYTDGTWVEGENYFLSLATAGKAELDTQTYAINDVYLFLGTGTDKGLDINIDVGFIIDSVSGAAPENVYKFEKILSNSENTVDIGYSVNSSTLVFVNGSATSDWTGSGTSVTLGGDILANDHLAAVSFGTTSVYQDVLAEDETVISLPFTMISSSLPFYNGAALQSSQYSGSITFSLDVKENDNTIIKE